MIVEEKHISGPLLKAEALKQPFLGFEHQGSLAPPRPRPSNINVLLLVSCLQLCLLCPIDPPGAAAAAEAQDVAQCCALLSLNRVALAD